jgi:hypothetical protein
LHLQERPAGCASKHTCRKSLDPPPPKHTHARAHQIGARGHAVLIIAHAQHASAFSTHCKAQLSPPALCKILPPPPPIIARAAGMPRHLRNEQLRRNLCGVAEALQDHQQQQQQQQQQVFPSPPPPPAAFTTAAGPQATAAAAGRDGAGLSPYPPQGLLQAASPSPAGAAAVAGSSSDSLRRSWEAAVVAAGVGRCDPQSSSASENNSSGRLPHVTFWGVESGNDSNSLGFMSPDPAAAAAGGGSRGSGGAAAAFPSDLIRLGSITESGE